MDHLRLNNKFPVQLGESPYNRNNLTPQIAFSDKTGLGVNNINKRRITAVPWVNYPASFPSCEIRRDNFNSGIQKTVPTWEKVTSNIFRNDFRNGCYGDLLDNLYLAVNFEFVRRFSPSHNHVESFAKEVLYKVENNYNNIQFTIV